ncbi:MAG TPA: ABC transporter substrate-binding protein, partial [Casimicrobiaceae bacterium]|nr:ABC transporter substrate-binding protein [Casimicrobiaceae bacterium]
MSTALAPRWLALARWATRLAAIIAAAACADVFAADAPRVLHVAFPVAETGFDPQALGDTYSDAVCLGIFDPLYRYDYFARPVALEPNTADGLPEITDGGRTYTIKVKRGIYFAADAAFNGRQRELTAQDYVYSIKRVFDPKVRSYWLYLFEQTLVGLEGPLERARKSGKFDYDEKIEGLQAIDRYTLRIRFKQPDYGFKWWLTTSSFAAVAREVVEKYQDESHRVMENPVGTGPYRLKSWTRGQRIVLEANPDFRDERYPPPGRDAGDAAIAKGLTGRKLPLTTTVDIAIIEEAQPRLLSFDRGLLDYVGVPPTLSPTVLDGDKLAPPLARRGVVLHRQIEPSLAFFFFNLDDPLVGGYEPAKIALRRAVALGYDREGAIRQLAKGQALLADQPIPPGLYGNDPSIGVKVPYDPVAARALLDRFGYKDRDGDGYRETPDGKPLTLQKGSTTDAEARSADELWKRNMDAIGIRIMFIKNKWPELNKMTEAGQMMMWGLGWISGIPDGDPFYSYLVSRNIGTSNDARLRLPEYDRLYEQAHAMPDGPARNAIYRKLNDIIASYAPWIITDYPYRNDLTQPWLKGFKANAFQRWQWAYYDVGPH